MAKSEPLKGPIVILKESFFVLKKYPYTFYKFGAVIVLSVFLIGVIAAIVGVLLFSLKVSPFVIGALAIVSLLILIFTQVWFGLGTTYALLTNFEGNYVSLKESLKATRSITIPFMFLNFISSMIVLSGIVALIIPGIVFSIWFSVAGIIFVKEGKRGLRALMASRDYIEGYTGMVFLYLFGFSLIGPIFGFVIRSVGDSLKMAPLGELLQFIVSMILAPMSALFSIGIYKELVRVKGVILDVKDYEKRKWKYILGAVIGVLIPISVVLFLISRAGDIFGLLIKASQAQGLV